MRVAPHRTLLALTAFIAVPAMALAVWEPAMLFWSASVPALLAAGCLIDALLSRDLLRDLKVEGDTLVRTTKGRDFEIRFRLMTETRSLRGVAAGVAVPSALRVVHHPEVVLGRLEAGQWSAGVLKFQALRRGRFLLKGLHVETVSPFGLWLVRGERSFEVELRVYPDLSRERRRLSALFLNRGGEGAHAIRQVGKGREFEQLREYQPGDDYVDIDWKATSRRGLPITRTFQIERTQEVYVVLDHSRLSGREIRFPLEEAGDFWDGRIEEHAQGGDVAVTTQLERFLDCALSLCAVAERQGDLFGFVSFADRVDRIIRSRNGRDHYHTVRDALYTLETEPVAPDFEELMVSLRRRLTRRALLVMLVDLSDPLTAESFFDSLDLISRQHLVLVNMIRPEHAHPLFASGDLPQSTSEVYRSLAGHFQWKELRETGRKLSHLGVELGLPDHADLSVDVVKRYLEVKQRQLI